MEGCPTVQHTIELAEAGRLLKKLAPEILHEWEDRVRAEVSVARHQDRLTLFDEMPLFLARMAQMLEGELELRGDDICREHGEQRAQEAGYAIDAVVLEYRLLRKTICSVLEEGGRLNPETREAITDYIEMAIQDAADRFVSVQQHSLRERTVRLEEADRRKDEFMAVLAHELRTPLSAVSNAVYILENVRVTDKVVPQLGTLRRQVGNLARLVDDMTDIASIVTGRIELNQAPIVLNDLAADAVASVQPLIDTRGQDLFVILPDEKLVVTGDATRLCQIVINLLNNAAQYTAAGGNIWFSLEKEGAEAVLQIKDTGIGIEPVMLPQIFDLFSQVSPREIRSANNMGIGLALVKRLVELHGGDITAHSLGRGHGAEFHVRLPLADH